MPQDDEAKQAAAQEAAREAAEDLHAGKGVDPLEALLQMEERATTLRETYPVTLMSGQTVDFTFRPLEGEEIDKIQERCTNWVKRGRGARVQELDTQDMNALLVSTACISPDWRDQRLRAKYGATHPHEVVRKALLPGTIDGLASRLLELSGYTDDLVASGKL